MTNIQTAHQLSQLQSETYVYAAIIAIAIFGISLLIANLINYQGGTDKSYVARFIGWLVTTVVGVSGFWLYNQTIVMAAIKQVSFQTKFIHTNMICLAITLLGSAIISIVVMLIFRNTKFGSILGVFKKSR